jgi:hypothetical protein
MSRPPATALLSPQELVQLGQALFGAQWQSQLARHLAISERSMRYLLTGGRPIHIGIVEDLLEEVNEQYHQLEGWRVKLVSKIDAAKEEGK